MPFQHGFPRSAINFVFSIHYSFYEHVCQEGRLRVHPALYLERLLLLQGIWLFQSPVSLYTGQQSSESVSVEAEPLLRVGYHSPTTTNKEKRYFYGWMEKYLLCQELHGQHSIWSAISVCLLVLWPISGPRVSTLQWNELPGRTIHDGRNSPSIRVECADELRNRASLCRATGEGRISLDLPTKRTLPIRREFDGSGGLYAHKSGRALSPELDADGRRESELDSWRGTPGQRMDGYTIHSRIMCCRAVPVPPGRDSNGGLFPLWTSREWLAVRGETGRNKDLVSSSVHWRDAKEYDANLHNGDFKGVDNGSSWVYRPGSTLRGGTSITRSTLSGSLWGCVSECIYYSTPTMLGFTSNGSDHWGFISLEMDASKQEHFMVCAGSFCRETIPSFMSNNCSVQWTLLEPAEI